MLLSNEEMNMRESSSDNLINKLGLRREPSQVMSVPMDDEEFSSFLSFLESSAQRKAAIPSVPSVPSSVLESQPSSVLPTVPSSEDLIPDFNKKIKLGIVQDDALEVLGLTLRQLKGTVGDVEDPRRLSAIAKEMSSLVTDIRRTESNSERKNDGEIRQQVIIYKPLVKNETHYEAVKVNE